MCVRVYVCAHACMCVCLCVVHVCVTYTNISSLLDLNKPLKVPTFEMLSSDKHSSNLQGKNHICLCTNTHITHTHNTHNTPIHITHT